MNRKRPAKPIFEIALVPSQDGLPPGDLHPYRHMDADTREALIVEDLVEILKEASLLAAKEGPSQALPLPTGGRN